MTCMGNEMAIRIGEADVLSRRSIGENGKPPCVKCHNEGFHCVLAGSRRGGDYSRHRQRSGNISQEDARQRVRSAQPSRLAGAGTTRVEPYETRRSRNHASEGIQNPLQALELLAKVAANEHSGHDEDDGGVAESFDDGDMDDGAGAADNRIENNSVDDTSDLLQWAGLTGLDLRTLGILLER